MEITIRNIQNKTVTLINRKITGIVGFEREKFLVSIDKEHVLFNGMKINKNHVGCLDKKFIFITDNVHDEILLYINKCNKKIKDTKNRINNALEMLEIDDNILTRRISELSSGEMRMLELLLILIYNPKVIVINEPFYNLDYYGIKMVKNVLYNLKTKYSKVIIISSQDPNIVYMLSDKVLFLEEESFLYDDSEVIFQNQELLTAYNIEIPNLVKFTNLAKSKGINIEYHKDIRDLIKDVYRHV